MTQRDSDTSIWGLIWSVVLILTPVLLLVGGLVGMTGSVSPFVTVASDSMEPNIETGETVVLVETSGSVVLAPDTITTAADARREPDPETSFGAPGDVIHFDPVTADRPIVHRVQFEVSEGDEWVHRIDADPQYETNHTCASAEHCPAPYDGYITAGDNNPTYDQLDGYQIVRDEQINGVVRFRVPLL